MLLSKSGEKKIIGLIHLVPMPGTPYYQNNDFERSLDKALCDAESLIEGGASGCLLQTVDRVYSVTDDTDYVKVSCMSIIAHEVRKLVGSSFLIGTQIMWNCITPSIAVAKAASADFVRCTALVGSTSSPFGHIESNPCKVLNYRKSIDAQSVALLAELSGYHFNSLEDFDKRKLLDLAFYASMMGIDAVEIFHKDEATNEQMALTVNEAFPNLSIMLGGGTNAENCARRLKYADGALVGSCFEDEKWGGAINAEKVKEYMDHLHSSL